MYVYVCVYLYGPNIGKTLGRRSQLKFRIDVERQCSTVVPNLLS